MADVEDYLQEGFDPRSVTIPRLRSILVTHNVDYPSTAKKPQLVELVTQNVLTKAPKLRAERAKAKRSSLGIVNAGSAQDISGWDDDEMSPPSRRVSRAKSPRKSSARVVKTVEEDNPRSRTGSRRISRSASRQLSMDPEEDFEREASVATSRMSSQRTVTPQIKPEPEDDDEQTPGYEDEPSVFTDDNPFQSGSSPAQATPKASARRRTAGDDVSRTAKSVRRRTAGTEYLRTSATPETGRRGKTPEFLVEAGEEFTPDAQLEIEDATLAGEVAPRKTSHGRQSSIKTPFVVLLLTLLGAYMAWYRQEKIAVGYCGLGRPAKQIVPDNIPVPDALLPLLEPLCEPCPQHAFCYEDYSVRCQDDFILQAHPLSLGGLIPLPPTCEPDSEKARRVKAVADRAVEELRDRRAKFECGELTDEAGQLVENPAIAEDELKESVSRKRAKKMSDKEFDELWEAAIGEITDREEIKVTSETTESEPLDGDEAPGSSTISTTFLSSTSLARIPLSCSLKRAIRSRLARYRLPIGLIGLVLLGVAYLRARYRKHMAAAAQVPALVDLVLGKLANQKELGDEDLDDSWLFLPNLRDDVLRAVHSLSERERIWHGVKAVVEQNSNVRTSQREGRSGEVGRAWEWIGPVKGEGARRRRSGRMSWAPDIATDTPEHTPSAAEMKKWAESRPIY